MSLKFCAAAGCRALVPVGTARCDAHPVDAGRAAADAKRRKVPWRKWYGLKVWKLRRMAQLTRAPLCAFCGRLAEVADHVVPHRGDWALFLAGDLQSLCGSCHSGAKQRAEGGRGGVDLRGDAAAAPQCPTDLFAPPKI